MADENSVLVKKVSPYPFNAQINLGSRTVELKVARVTSFGMLAYSESFLRTSVSGEVKFEIPVLQLPVQTQARVVKAYEQPAAKTPVSVASSEPNENSKNLNIQRIVELHFLSLTEKDKDNIKRFLKAIKQRDS